MNQQQQQQQQILLFEEIVYRINTIPQVAESHPKIRVMRFYLNMWVHSDSAVWLNLHVQLGCSIYCFISDI